MENLASNDSSDYVVEYSPGGVTKFYIPQCDPTLKPYVKQKFKSRVEGEEFYRKYAGLCGFDTRKGTARKSADKKVMIWRYIYCNREGFKNAAIEDDDGSSIKRRTVSKRVGCKARVVFKFNGSDGYVITKFIERHTHTFVPDAYKHFLKMNSKMETAQQKYIMTLAKANIGLMKSYRVLKDIAGSYANIGFSKNQAKNLGRDMKSFVIGADAQMLVDRLRDLKVMYPAYVYDCELDEKEQLRSLFWADPIAIRHFFAFGDVVSFDATYNTNKYKMIFAPFTGKDNHGRCVTLGAALMSGESIESYAWVFDKFKKCMGREPSILITDQDPAILIAFGQVFTECRHRLCMWHIMSKVPDKVPVELKKDPSFMKEFCSIVWSVNLDPEEFEDRWNDIMERFGLTNHPLYSWFEYMFHIREIWLPAYFRDVKMGGLFRTTSPSESENSFFRMHMSKNSNLLEFFMFFESALESQRHSQARLNNEDLSSHCDFRTLLPFEKHAASIYTRHIFNELQDEFEFACYKCRLTNIIDDEARCLYDVGDYGDEVFNVIYDKVENTVDCSCKKFVRIGLLCSHVFFVFKDLNLQSIPEKYIVNRWTKLALSHTAHEVGAEVLKSNADIDGNRYILNDIMSEFYRKLGLVADDPVKSHSLLEHIRSFENGSEPSEENSSNHSAKKRLFEEFYGSTVPEEVFVKPPRQVNNKGSRLRFKSSKDKAIEKSKKPPRKCSKCGVKSDHDARNCPN